MITDWTQEIEAFFNKKFSFMKLRVGARETFNIWYDDITWKAWLWLDNAVVVFNQIKYLGSLQEFFNFRLQRFCDHTLEYFFYKYYVAVIKDDPSREVEWAYFRWYLNEVYWPYIQEVFSLNLSYYKGFFVHEILNAYNKVFYLGTLSYYGLNWVHSFIYYPIFYIWRHTFGQAWVTLLYLANVIWHWDYYSFSGGLSFSRVISSFGYSFSIFVAHIFNFFVQLKLMFVEGCKFYVEGIFYPFICMYWYFVKTKDFFYDSFMDSYGLYVNIFYHSSISVYVRTLFNDFKTIYYMALGETSDLPNENKKLSVKESESLVEKLSVSELYNNKQKYSKDIVDTYEKNPEAYVTDSWNLDPKVTQASIDVYEELGKVNLFEDYYPLTPSERVLDSLDMLDKSQRNIDVLRAIGRWHESVILQTIVYENHIDTRNYSWGFDKLRIHAKIWVPLHDYFVDFISFSEIAPNLRRWIGETYVI
ncbi:MAG: hypothetical protein CME69_11945 [Halobacteriovorax sp.]|nr:hypothetical protein [Halobacteriovorax sp.]|tara:strand:+ start:14267 stop:15691 length:1425 start_codon:yes stop_codon:yes gene_type:complete